MEQKYNIEVVRFRIEDSGEDFVVFHNVTHEQMIAIVSASAKERYRVTVVGALKLPYTKKE